MTNKRDECEWQAAATLAFISGEVFAQCFHLGEGVLVAGAVGGGDASVEAVEGLGGAIELGEGLGGHLVGGDVVGVVLDQRFELCEGLIRVALAEVLHGEAVAGEGVGGVGSKDFVEGGEFGVGVHELILVGRLPSGFRLGGMGDEVRERTVEESQSERSEIVFPADSNALGNLFGGRLMQYIDLVGAMAASRHARAITVTASMDHLDFVAPVRMGELLILKASVNRAFRTSMEVGVRVMVEDVRKQQLRHVSSAYLTFVAVDREGNRVVVPQVMPETEHQRRRYEDAGRRREMRAGETQRKKEMRAALGAGWHV